MLLSKRELSLKLSETSNKWTLTFGRCLRCVCARRDYLRGTAGTSNCLRRSSLLQLHCCAELFICISNYPWLHYCCCLIWEYLYWCVISGLVKNWILHLWLNVFCFSSLWQLPFHIIHSILYKQKLFFYLCASTVVFWSRCQASSNAILNFTSRP